MKTDAIEDLFNDILNLKTATVSELSSAGMKYNACPYFSARRAVPISQLVLVPYQVSSSQNEAAT